MKAEKSGALLCVLVVVSLSPLASTVGAQCRSGPVIFALKSFPISAAAGGYELVNHVLDLPPGAGVANHSHGGPVVVTVISGELTLIEGGTETLVKPGESWTEKVGYVHAVANRGTTTVRLALSYLIPAGAARTTWVK